MTFGQRRNGSDILHGQYPVEQEDWERVCQIGTSLFCFATSRSSPLPRIISSYLLQDSADTCESLYDKVECWPSTNSDSSDTLWTPKSFSAAWRLHSWLARTDWRGASSRPCMQSMQPCFAYHQIMTIGLERSFCSSEFRYSIHPGLKIQHSCDVT